MFNYAQPGAFVLSGDIGSGQIGSDHIAEGAIVTVDIASGQVDANQIASGAVRNVHLASGAVRSGHISSGAVGFGALANEAVGSGTIASGSVARFQIASGGVSFINMSDGSVRSGAVNSGELCTYHLASGASATAASFVAPLQSGTSWTLLTEEIISGVRAVQISQSGYLRQAMASVSGKMPAIGVVSDNILSGMPASVYSMGYLQVTSGLADFSGWLGRPCWVGRSGQIVQWSGSFNSGGLNTASGGDFIQRLGFIANSGGFVVNVDPGMLQTQLVGTTNSVDVANRQFGV